MLVLAQVAALEVHQGLVWRVLDKPLAAVWAARGVGPVELGREVRGQLVLERVGQGARVVQAGPGGRVLAVGPEGRVLAVGPGGRVLADQEQVGLVALVPTLVAPAGLTRKPA